MRKVKYKKLIFAFFGGFKWSDLFCVNQVLFDKKTVEYNATRNAWEVPDEHGVRDGEIFTGVGITGNTIVQIDFTLVRVAEAFTYWDGSATQNDVVPAGGIWTIPNTVRINAITTADGNIFNLENADQARIWSYTQLNQTLDILNTTILTDVVSDTRFRSIANEFGYTLSGSEIIPAYVVDNKYVSAADGSDLEFKGQVRLNTQMVDSNILSAIGGETLINANIGSWTIAGFTGDITPTKIGTTITLAAGRLSELILNDGVNDHIYPVSEGGALLIEDTSVINPQHLTLSSDIWALDTTAESRPDSHIDGFSQKLVCETSGVTYITNTAAYGRISFCINKKLNTNTSIVIPINANQGTAGDNATGYVLIFTVSESIIFRSYNNGNLDQSLFSTASGYIDFNEKYCIDIERNSVVDEFAVGAIGTFGIYISGGSFGNTPVLIDTSGGSGTNPVTDNNYTTSDYFTSDLDSSDEIKNILVNGVYKNMMTSTDVTGVYARVRVPKTSVIDVEGDELSNPPIGFDNPESKLLQYPSPQMRASDEALTTPLWTDGAGNFVKVPWSTFNDGDGNFENGIIYNKDPIKKIVTLKPNASTLYVACFNKVITVLGLFWNPWGEWGA